MRAGPSPVSHPLEWRLTLKDSNTGSLAEILQPRPTKVSPKFFMNMEEWEIFILYCEGAL